ncbi:isocitrate dehydrogenase kinase/phosphatase [Polynucleobacter sp. SHI8]|uniref:bifunctional isocitrate dehydrogenase kinase/phosphatase n=1 Tax=unclassified Polynucleobacter TaxID=2640945 RepID=UPI0024915A2B|nr:MULTISPECIES: bifunctional isocitrate dehydrogenase kinase/phosphatase [unclassified Polynucleobacter]BDW12198.1 isocitrate dehydrogenase kinase/phosphatase [Polynucleobacter sp. SHI2]BDW14646.1 isocitrate dehydrogenase kinase/phosphatase [Polynucleobacter sp. SHI8]
MSNFPKLLSSQYAYDMAQVILEGFDKHYRIFREASFDAKKNFESQNWNGIRELIKGRIDYYAERVSECIIVLDEEFDAANLDTEIWQQVKLHYIGLLTHHHQPELAETFFNSIITRVLNHTYFHNDFIFLRPTISTEYIENDEIRSKPTYKAHYPKTREDLKSTFNAIVTSYDLEVPFDHLDQNLDALIKAVDEKLGAYEIRVNFQIHVLTSLFFRNKMAYIVGRIINGEFTIPMVIALQINQKGLLEIDAILLNKEEVSILFSFTYSYFLVEMEVPSAYVTFLRTLMPRKPRQEIYTSLGLQKHGKNLFYRDFLHHLHHSTDQFRIAPGIKGLVMLVFDLPSYPYVFKLIKDYFPPPKETTRELIMSKYQLVKQHDRVGRMADTLEFSNIALPLDRFEPELLAELEKHCKSLLSYIENDAGEKELMISHLYIERRMIPLNIMLQTGSDEQVEKGLIEYGNAIKELIAANIFPGDMLYKNFGLTRHGRVVFYDYDEIEYFTDCNIRNIPQARTEEEEMSGETWYHVGPKDIFPESYGTFLLGDTRVNKYFMKHHADFFDPQTWRNSQNILKDGRTPDHFGYPEQLRFKHRYPPN